MNPLKDRDVNGNTFAWLQDLDRADQILCECAMCSKKVTEDEELCSDCKSQEIDGT